MSFTIVFSEQLTLIASELTYTVLAKCLNSIQTFAYQFQSGAPLNAGQTIDIAGSQYSISNKTDNCIAFKQEVVQ